MRKLLFILSLTIGLANPVSSEIEAITDTGKLYQACKLIAGKSTFTLYEDAEVFQAGQCIAALRAVGNTIGMQCARSYVTGKTEGMYYADTFYVSTEALIQAFVNYAEKRPQDWNEYYFFTITAALKEYFPCGE